MEDVTESAEQGWWSWLTGGTEEPASEPIEKRQHPDEEDGPIDGSVERGSTGLRRSNGYIHDEWHPKLRGRRAVQVYRQMRDNDATINAVLYAIESLILQAPWKIETVSDPTPEQIAARDFVRSALFDDMEHTWQEFLGELLSMITYGWAYFETVYKRRSGSDSRFDDGMVGWKKFAIRGQDTLERWKMDEHGTVHGMYQVDYSTGVSAFIPSVKALHFTFRSHLNSPEGRSGLRGAYTSWFFLTKLMTIEAIGIERDLAGMPVMQLPPKMMAAKAGTPLALRVDEFFTMVKNIRMDEQMGAVIPGEKDAEGRDTGYKLSLLSTGGRNASASATAIDRYRKEIAMTLLAQFLHLGMDRVGSFALADNTTELFAVALGATMDRITAAFNRQGIARLCELNGIPQSDWPKLVHGDVESRDIQKLSAAIKTLVEAGAMTPDGLEDHLREAMGLPPVEALVVEEGEEVPVEAKVLSGIQISTATSIASQVNSGELTPEQATALLQTFFGLDPVGAKRIVGELAAIAPTPEPEATAIEQIAKRDATVVKLMKMFEWADADEGSRLARIHSAMRPAIQTNGNKPTEQA